MPYPYDNDLDAELPLREKPDLAVVIEALKSEELDATVSSTVYYGLSALSPRDINQVKPVWEDLNAERRQRLLSELADASELNFELDYRELGFFALQDKDPNVRAAAIDLLWEDESPELISKLMNLAEWDESADVRAAATSALGRFILMGEYGNLSEQAVSKIQDVVINLLHNDDEDLTVRRRALETIANSSHEMVEDAINEAYHSNERLMKVSAVFAMGRTCDARWRDTVLREMASHDPEIRYEAARSAGELEIPEAVPALGRLTVEGDREIKEVAIWSLGEIGGREALRILSALAEDASESNDDDLLDSIEDAIGNASLVGDELDFDLDEED